ncbi:MAG TPA: PIN domain-containing protein [Candidatus Saccharimonadales bacterium]|nr:PIN domain-containing protein [Candidatus Saccharimonadales bacterium]
MTIVLDTNTLIRFFTRDIEERAQKVKELLEKEKKLFIPDVVFPEIEYILEKKYMYSRKEIFTYFQFLTSLPNVSVTKYIKKACYIYNQTKLDMADCIIASYSVKGKLASFDKLLLKVNEVVPYWV